MMEIKTVEGKTEEHEAQVHRRLRPMTLIAAFLVVLPAVIFYSILFRKAVNIPDVDDYGTPLEFLNRLAVLPDLSSKVSYFLSAQHNEYKLFFEHALIWIEVGTFGHVDFRLLCAIGNGFVLLLAILLWKMFLPGYKDITSRLLFFIPVSWLIFQLQYVELLDWAMPSLQHLPSLFFSLSAIYFLMRTTQKAYYCALVCLVLAICSSGNAMLMIPIGALILARRNKYARIASWLIVSAGCVAAYAYHYNFMSQSSNHHSVFWVVAHARPLSVLVFIGNATSVPVEWRLLVPSVLLCPILGLALCVLFVAMMRRRYFHRNPLVGYCVLFLLLTALGVAGIRSGGGNFEEAASRYGIHSALLLSFAWFAIAEEFLLPDDGRSRRGLLAAAIAVAILFSVGMDYMGWRYLTGRDRELISGMTAFEHPEPSGLNLGPVLPMHPQPSWMDLVDRTAGGILRESMRLGIYQPPKY